VRSSRCRWPQAVADLRAGSRVGTGWQSISSPGDHKGRTKSIEPDRVEVTRILNALGRGEEQAARDLLPLVYDELRRLAAWRLAQESPGQTLQATALVHEAYLRLVGPDAGQPWDGRGHFFAAAAEAMRRIVLDRARDRKRLKRGGSRRREALDLDGLGADDAPPDDLIDLDEALGRLAEVDARSAELVKLRLFAGLTLDEAAEAMGVVRRTAERDWAFARAWLFQQLAARDSS
jgi:RNA polymerase sigma factor (TIGR02999 family)